MDQIGKAPETDLFLKLTPNLVLDAVERSGLRCEPVCYPLNSFENRVYEVELEDGQRIVAKFYRPGRWSRQQIEEEHQFMVQLLEEEVAICGNRPFPDGSTLKEIQGIWYCLYDRAGGRAPDELTPDMAYRIGMMTARIHNVGAAMPAHHRLRLSGDTFIRNNVTWLLDHDSLPATVRQRYVEAANQIADAVDSGLVGVPLLRIHGDFHMGNLLAREGVLHALDFDDMMVGPAVQDLWLVLPGTAAENGPLVESLLEGYEQFRAFDRTTLSLIEPLRGLRMVHYAAWLARRWHDPVFAQVWPHFGTEQYWSQETASLEAIVAGLKRPSHPSNATPAAAEEEPLTNKDFFFDWEE